MALIPVRAALWEGLFVVGLLALCFAVFRYYARSGSSDPSDAYGASRNPAGDSDPFASPSPPHLRRRSPARGHSLETDEHDFAGPASTSVPDTRPMALRDEGGVVEDETADVITTSGAVKKIGNADAVTDPRWTPPDEPDRETIPDRTLAQFERLGTDEVFTVSFTTSRIGRHDDNDIRIDEPSIHRYHAALRYTPDGEFVITDLRWPDGNGVLVNDERHERVSLRDGELVTLGDVVLEFRSRTGRGPQTSR